jgi:rare lipoprotein A
MNTTFLMRSSAALLLAIATFAQAQTASAPDAAPMAAPAPVPAAAPAPAAAVKAAPAAKEAPAAAAAGDSSEGKVAYYGRKFAGRKTASGERFNPNAMTMAHKTLPFGTLVKVTNVKNGKHVTVRVNDRGPSTADRIGDLTQAAARKIRMTRSGVIDAKLDVVGMSKHGHRGHAHRRHHAK